MVKVGDKVAAGTVPDHRRGDKASMEVRRRSRVPLKRSKSAPAIKVKTGSLIMVFEVEGRCACRRSSSGCCRHQLLPRLRPLSLPLRRLRKQKVKEFAENDAYVHATPLIHRLAREFGVNLAKVKGTGRKGRILREDVQAYVKTRLNALNPHRRLPLAAYPGHAAVAEG